MVRRICVLGLAVLGVLVLSALPAPAAATAADWAIYGVELLPGRAVLLAGSPTDGEADLYSAPLDGGPIVRLTADLPPSQIGTFVISPAGRVVFAARHYATGLRYLYSVPATGGELTLLGPSYPASPPPLISSQLVLALAGERAIFAVDASVANGFELYSVPVAGGPATRLSPELPPVSVSYPAPFWVNKFAINDGDGLRVAFNVHRGPVPQGSGLYTVPADGSASPTRIGEAVDAHHSNRIDLTPDGQRVVYNQGAELHTVSFAGGDDTLIDPGAGGSFVVTPDSSQIVYALTGDSPDGGMIKRAPVVGGTVETVATGVRYSGSLTFQLTPDSSGVLYNNPDRSALLLAPLGGGPIRTVITLPAGPHVTFADDGSRAIFIAGEFPSLSLYSYPLGGGQAIRIDDPAVSAGGALLFDGVVAGDRVIYSAQTAGEEAYSLYSVPMGGGATTLLGGPFGAGEELLFVQGADAGGTVAFISGSRIFLPQSRWRHLYAVPADASAAPILIAPPSPRLTYLPLARR